jgi:hypothetical protein
LGGVGDGEGEGDGEGGEGWANEKVKVKREECARNWEVGRGEMGGAVVATDVKRGP